MPLFTLDAWLRPIVPRLTDDRMRLLCPTAFHRDRVRERFLPIIERTLEAEEGRAIPVEVVAQPPVPSSRARSVRPPGGSRRTSSDPGDASGRDCSDAAAHRTGAADEALPAAASPPAPAGAAPPVRSGTGAVAGARPGAPVQPELPYRFDTFVVGPCNALAREASLAVALGRQQRLNPLFLSAGEGLGKTHLARAIGSEARARGAQRVLYASAEAFTNDFMRAIRSKEMEPFKRRYRDGCRLLILEDVQFLRAKRATQLELFHTISHLLDVGGRVVLTGDRLPRDIEGLDPRLRSQMTAGMVAEIEPPDVTVRREILRRIASSGGVRLPEDCREMLVHAVRGSVRDLEGVLIQLVASASLLKRPIDEELTRRALHKLQPMREERGIDPTDVLDTVAAFFRARPETLASRSRRRDVLWPRQLVMYLCCRYTRASQAQIGRLLGREHTAVRNAVQVVERAMLEHAPRRYQVEALCVRIDELAKERRRG